MINNKYILGVIIILFLFLIIKILKYGHFNNREVILCDTKNKCDTFNVHAGHEDYNDAAYLMKEIRNRVDKLLNHLKNKYSISDSKNNKYLVNRIDQLLNNYDYNNIFEISPKNEMGVTSYSDNKTKLILCMRKKNKNSDLHDINTMMFVVIHELAHMMNNRWGHSKSSNFWQLFKFLLVNSLELGLYTPVNYSTNPIVYCGLEINYNPIYDNNLSIDNIYI